MSDFDSELRQRLQRLEAAVPESPPPLMALSRRPVGKRGQMVLAMAAVLALVVGTAIVASGTTPPRTPGEIARDAADEARVSDDIAMIWSGACLNESQATAFVRERLDAFGLQNWTIRTTGVSEAPCVGAAAIGDSHEVMLTPSMGQRVNDALEALKLTLLQECLGPDEAAQLLRTTLESAGISDPSIVVGGLRGVPGPAPDSDESESYLQHFNNGCVVFGDAQWDQNGRYRWALASR